MRRNTASSVRINLLFPKSPSTVRCLSLHSTRQLAILKKITLDRVGGGNIILLTPLIWHLSMEESL